MKPDRASQNHESGVLLRLLQFLLFLLLTPALNSLAQSPPNDFFANRIVLSGTNFTAVGSSTNATKESFEPDHAGNLGGRSVWWTWTAPTNGDLTITTDASDFDTLLGVYTGATVAGLSLVASNDDHGIIPASRVRFQALAGTQYQIAVDGYNADTNAPSASYGKAAVTLNFISEPITRPANDNFSNRIPLTGNSPGVVATNILATRQPGEPLHADRAGDTSLWWTWVAPASDTVKISTAGSTFDTVLAVYTGTSVSNLTVVASNDDEDPLNAILTSSLILNATAGQTYQIAVDGFDGASGRIALSFASVKTKLTNPVSLPGGFFQFTLSGLPGKTNEIQISTNLADWIPLATIVNTNGTTLITDPTATNSSRRFYRALLK